MITQQFRIRYLVGSTGRWQVNYQMVQRFHPLR